MTKTLALATLLALSTGMATAQSTTWTATGAHGGTASGSRDCSTTDGVRNCTGSRTATGAYGRTQSVETDRVTQYGSTSVTGTRTGTFGGSASFTRGVSR